MKITNNISHIWVMNLETKKITAAILVKPSEINIMTAAASKQIWRKVIELKKEKIVNWSRSNDRKNKNRSTKC